MNDDEVRDMIGRALRDEPPVGVDYDTVVADGRRRRVRRQFGIVGGAVLGVAVAVSSAVLVGQLSASPALIPANPGPTTSSTSAPTPPGCAIPARTGGFSDAPSGKPSAEELAESSRLTQAFARFAIPLPAGVRMDPAALQLCVINQSWGTRFTLHSPAGDRSVFLEVRSTGPRAPDVCPLPSRGRCTSSTLADKTEVKIVEDPPTSATMPAIVNVTGVRADGTLVRLMETGAEAPHPVPRILTDDALAKIVSAPQLKVNWPAPAVDREPTEKRATELTKTMSQSGVLADGVVLAGFSFRVSQGGYKLSVDITDNAGAGNLFINLNPPAADGSVSCANQPGCELITLPDNRKATVTRIADAHLQRLMLNTVVADGTQLYLMTTNQSEKAATQGKTTPTRPTPPLGVEDLVRIAGQSWLHW